MNKNEVNIKVYSAGDAPAETDQIDYDLVKLPKTWALWEGYENPVKDNTKENKDEDWKRSIKQVFEFNDIITFWQLWNNSPFSRFSDIFNNGERIRYFYETKLRINSINFFSSGICPAWEDPENKGAWTLSFQYEIKNVEQIMQYLNLAQGLWLKLVMNCLGENIDGAEFINGIRFIDKSSFQPGKKNFFRFEVWVNKRINEEIYAKEGLYQKLKNRLNDVLEATCSENTIK